MFFQCVRIFKILIANNHNPSGWKLLVEEGTVLQIISTSGRKFKSIGKVYKFLKSNLKDSEKIERKRKKIVKKVYTENFLKMAIINSATQNRNNRLNSYYEEQS